MYVPLHGPAVYLLQIQVPMLTVGIDEFGSLHGGDIDCGLQDRVATLKMEALCSSKRLYLSTCPYDVTIHKPNIGTLIAMRALNVVCNNV